MPDGRRHPGGVPAQSWGRPARLAQWLGVLGRDPVRLWLLVSGAWILLGVLWRLPTLGHLHDYDQFSFGHLQYSDIVKFYFDRHLPAHQVPYIQQDVEYPVITGVVIWLTAFVPGISGYFLANALLLAACLLGCSALLTRMGPSVLPARFAAAPGLVMYSVLNWDALGLIGLVGALYCIRRRQFGWGGTALALGASAKLFPAFILPVLLAHAAQVGRTEETRAGSPGEGDASPAKITPARRLLKAFVATFLAVNAPMALLNWRGWSYFVTFQAGRPLNPDTIWRYLPTLPDSTITMVVIVLYVFVLVWVTLDVWFNRGAGWEAAALISLLTFLIVTRDYSPQYDLWLLPLLAVLACPLRLWILFVAADLAYYCAIFLYLFGAAGGHLPVSNPNAMLGFTVWEREFVLLMLAAWAYSRVRLPQALPMQREGR